MQPTGDGFHADVAEFSRDGAPRMALLFGVFAVPVALLVAWMVTTQPWTLGLLGQLAALVGPTLGVGWLVWKSRRPGRLSIGGGQLELSNRIGGFRVPGGRTLPLARISAVEVVAPDGWEISGEHRGLVLRVEDGEPLHLREVAATREELEWLASRIREAVDAASQPGTSERRRDPLGG